MDGFLFKLGEKGVIKTFKKRWFVLDESRRHLYYYKPKDRWHSFRSIRPDISKLLVAGRIDLKAVTDVHAAGFHSGSKRWRMALQRANRTYILESEICDEIDKWVAILSPNQTSNEGSQSHQNHEHFDNLRSTSALQTGLGLMATTRTNRSVSAVVDGGHSYSTDGESPRERALTANVQSEVIVVPDFENIKKKYDRSRSDTVQYLDSLLDGVRKDGRQIGMTGGMPPIPKPPVRETKKKEISNDMNGEIATEFADISLAPTRQSRKRELSRFERASTKVSPASVDPNAGSHLSALIKELDPNTTSAVMGGLGVSLSNEMVEVDGDLDGFDEISFEPVSLEVPADEINMNEERKNIPPDLERRKTLVDMVEDSMGDDGFLSMGDMQMEGFLLKRSRNVLDRWQRRFFVMNTNAIVYYHQKPTTSPLPPPNGIIPFETIMNVRHNDVKGCDGTVHFVLEVHVPTRVYELEASGREVRKKWIDALGVVRHMKLHGPLKAHTKKSIIGNPPLIEFPT